MEETLEKKSTVSEEQLKAYIEMSTNSAYKLFSYSRFWTDVAATVMNTFFKREYSFIKGVTFTCSMQELSINCLREGILSFAPISLRTPELNEAILIYCIGSTRCTLVNVEEGSSGETWFLETTKNLKPGFQLVFCYYGNSERNVRTYLYTNSPERDPEDWGDDEDEYNDENGDDY